MWNSGAEATTVGGGGRPAEVDGVAVRQHGALGATGRPAGEDDRRRVVLGDRDLVGSEGRRRGPRQQVRERPRALLAEVQRRGRRRQGVGHLVVGPGRVEDRGDRPAGDGAEGDQAMVERRAPSHRHAVPPLDTGGGEPGGDIVHPVRKVAERDRTLALDGERPVAVLGGSVHRGGDRPRPLGEHGQPRPQNVVLDHLEEAAGAEEPGERVGIERVPLGPTQPSSL
jgi:hypothetical protein